MAAPIPTCCLKSSPPTSSVTLTSTSHVGTLASLPCYITSAPPSSTSPTNKPKVAILIVHDLLGYTSPPTQHLADSYASLLSSLSPDLQTTVYIPDFFGGETLDADAINENRWADLDMAGFMSRNGREQRESSIFACARALREEHGYEKVAAVGFCYGGWAALRLGSRLGEEKPLVDAVIIGHPSLVTKEDIKGICVPTQILAVEHDPVFTPELKMFIVQNLMERRVAFDFQFFPGVEHGALVRGDEKREKEGEAMKRARDVAVAWMGMAVGGRV
jgi:dienelactone hydrolase